MPRLETLSCKSRIGFANTEVLNVVTLNAQRVISPPTFEIWEEKNDFMVILLFLSFAEVLCTNIDPDPVKASHPQYLQKQYRIEFNAHTHVWA